MLQQSIEIPSPSGPPSKWTAETRAQFLEHLSRNGNVRAACLRVGVSAEIAYRLRRRDAAFARGWSAAMILARREAEQVLAERAIEGVIEDVYYRGEWVGSRRRHDARLLLAHLARLDKLAENKVAREDAERFDEILAVVAGEEIPDELLCADDVLPASRRDYVAEAACAARIERLHSPSDPDEADDDVLLAAEERWEQDTAAQEALEAECDDAAMEAGFAAGQQWDAWHARVCEAVDRALAAAPPLAASAELPAGGVAGDGMTQPERLGAQDRVDSVNTSPG